MCPAQVKLLAYQQENWEPSDLFFEMQPQEKHQ